MKAKETLELGELLNARIPPMDFYASVCATSGANNRNEGALAEKRGAGQEKKRACVCGMCQTCAASVSLRRLSRVSVLTVLFGCAKCPAGVRLR